MARIVIPAEPLSDGPTALRGWRDADISAIVAACQDPEIPRWTRVPLPYRETDAKAYMLQRHEAIHAGTMAPFAIVAAADPEHLLGSISLLHFAWRHYRAEVGYWLAREGRGQGHVTRAVELICAWGFETLELERIELLAATGNTASQRVAERAGFQREGLLRSHTVAGERRLDMVAYARLATPQRPRGAPPASRGRLRAIRRRS
ncbi:MAG: GNAT family N-acetyltransferase [Solirubrobacteraceae bacterium]